MENERLVAWYSFEDQENVGKDSSGNENHAIPMGERRPVVKEVCGRCAAVFDGGKFGVSYLELPKDLLKNVGDQNGLTISAWVCGAKAENVWERIFDFGKGSTGPYIFLTRFMRGVCFKESDLAADAGKALPVNEWTHIAMTVTGTEGGTLSSAGPRVYINGELAADGFISQTSSGTYKKLREWFATFEDIGNYGCNYIGHSQFGADADFCGAISDFRVYEGALAEQDIIQLMCASLSDEQILKLAKEKYLPAPKKIIREDMELPESLVNGKVSVKWSCDKPEVIGADGKVTAPKAAVGVCITAELFCGELSDSKSFLVSVLPKELAPYEITVHGGREVLDISKTLYGLFYEDINNAADGGIYAEMIQNRSFEAFRYDTYDFRSGENGISTGRNHEPLRFWFGDTDKVSVKNQGGLNEYFGLEDADTNAYYIEVQAGTNLYNRGFCDNTHQLSMNLKAGEEYYFTVWAKADAPAKLTLSLVDEKDNTLSNQVTVCVEGDGQWKKYTAEPMIAKETRLSQLKLFFGGEMAVDMLSMMPSGVWGAAEEETSASAHANYKGNSNYRLRRDLVEMLVEMHPTFLRFPGGCISEGSYIWENVYDWKESVGSVEVRKENFNVWGYMMTMGLGYMEYFQLAEDLNAEPLPVMACGVLCQARSDYANPAGGKLQKKYIDNFTDLIDFAISTDFENNKWAALRKEMGHEAPFGLHYLGVGNENWGTEFFANFEAFKYAIDCHMEKNYPDYELHIISTAGAQADDDAYQSGWKFLAGYMKGGANVRFTDGEQSFEEEVTWYENSANYMDTIVDEHYYRANDYLLENADRYNYYYRAYKDGKLDETQTSKVFVGEYASSDKNTLAGAVAEAAVMTGFEKNSDVVRLAATAPLFNKVVSDGTYRWTPDAIWFDNESVWRTPNYYVQQLFAKYIGKKLLDTSFATYFKGEKKVLAPHGGILVAASGEVNWKQLTVTCNTTGEVIFVHDFGKVSDVLKAFKHADMEGFYLDAPEWKNYKVDVKVEKQDVDATIFVGAGLEGKNLLQYCVGDDKRGTGLKVYKEGKEAYTMGDYSSSVYAGNLRACYDEKVETGKEYEICVNYGGEDGRAVICYYHETGSDTRQGLLECKLEAYNRDIYHSVTADEQRMYLKLVNAEGFTKKVDVKLEDIAVKSEAEWIVLTGDTELVHCSNVNTKDGELIVPVSKKILLLGNSFEVELPANSVSVIVLDK
ncbi:MAG: carbohydrate binding domain-containing protein [Lachnospiraceae bacterium]|nr:carbohydrate binding domain-containing protein [Lachnospiraceae bacterium]